MLRTAEIVLPKGKHTNYLSKAVLETCLNGNGIVQAEQVVFIYLGICVYVCNNEQKRGHEFERKQGVWESLERGKEGRNVFIIPENKEIFFKRDIF